MAIIIHMRLKFKTMDIFLEATKIDLLTPYRPANGGAESSYNIPDLWKLDLSTLDLIAINLSQNIEATKVSFVSESKTNVNRKDFLRLELVKAIIKNKLAAVRKVEQDRVRKEALSSDNEALIAAIKLKEQSELANLTTSELKARLALQNL